MRLFKEKAFKLILKISPMIIGLIIAVSFNSRAFSIGFVLAITTLLFLDKQVTLSRRAYLLTTLTILALLFFSIFLIKTDSSLGRMLIYKIAANIYREHWLYGIGIGNFKEVYMYYQADYFRLGKFSQQELLLADNTYYAFNDYFQLIIETGVIGVLFILFSVLSIYQLAKIALSYSNAGILWNAIGMMIAGCTAAFFNFVFYRFEFQVAGILCILIIAYFTLKKNEGEIKIISSFLLFLIICLYCTYNFLTIGYFSAYEKLKEARDLERAGYRNEAMVIVKALPKELTGSHEYLELTSFLYTNAMMLKEAKQETVKLMTVRPSSDASARLGYIYEMNNEYKDAEKAYLMAIDMVPNRFTTRYKLFMLYKKTDQKNKAMDCGKIILSMPVKIPSPIIDRIKSNVNLNINH